MAIKEQLSGFSGLAVSSGISVISASVISVALAYSGFFGGNAHFLSATNVAPSLLYDSGSYLTFTQQRLTASGTATMAAEIVSPDLYASGAVLQAANVECGNKANTLTGSLVLSTESLGPTVKTLRTYVYINTGSLMRASTGTIKVTDTNYLKFVTASGSSPTKMNGNCMLKAWWNEKYGR